MAWKVIRDDLGQEHAERVGPHGDGEVDGDQEPDARIDKRGGQGMAAGMRLQIAIAL